MHGGGRQCVHQSLKSLIGSLYKLILQGSEVGKNEDQCKKGEDCCPDSCGDDSLADEFACHGSIHVMIGVVHVLIVFLIMGFAGIAWTPKES